MKKFRKLYKKHTLFVLGGVVLLFFVYFLFMMRQKDYFSNIGDFIRDVSFKIEEVFLPKGKLDYTDFSKTINLEMKKELEEMKKLLELKQTMSEFKMVHATIISRNKEDWFHTITIDKGTKEGIKEDMAVMTDLGLIGKVLHASRSSSEVKLITTNEENHKIAVSVETSGNVYNGLLHGYDKEHNFLLVTSIRSTSDIPVGSVVRTNGLGEIFPRGIYVGVVESIEYDSLGISKVLKVKSKINFEDLRFVSVVSREVSP